MVLELDLLNTNLKPVFDIKVFGVAKPLQALIDTGSTKTIWCSEKYVLSKSNLASFKFEDTGETTTLSGFGLEDQKDCKIYKGSFNIYRKGMGIVFWNVGIVDSKKKVSAFDMILPYPLFREFEYTFKPASRNDMERFGRLIINTLDNKVYYKVKSYGGVVSEVYAEDSAMDSTPPMKLF